MATRALILSADIGAGHELPEMLAAALRRALAAERPRPACSALPPAVDAVLELAGQA